MAGLLQDVRLALRQLRKNPGFAITAIAMLAIAICANSTILSWINGTMLHPIPTARDTGSLVSVMRGQWSITPSPPFSYLDYCDLRDRNQSFSGMLAYHHDWLTLTGTGTPERIYVVNVSANFFDVLGIKPALGRFFLPSEEVRSGGVPYIVLSYSLWQTRFAGDPAIVGKSIELARHPLTVIGVAPAGFINAMPGVKDDAWLPLAPLGTDSRLTQRSASYYNVLGRLKPGISRQRATRDLETIMHQLVTEFPNDHPGVNTITLDPMWRSPFGANVYLAATLPIVLAIAGVVLLLTCVNVATLALIRFVSRRREIAIRQSLGAGRIQLMRQMIIEGVLVSLAGGALALLLTSWTAKRLEDFIPASSIPIVLNGNIDRGVILATLLLALLASTICGAFPAWRACHTNATEVLKDEAASVSGGGHNRHVLSGLVVAQVALSLALLVASGLLLRTLRNISGTDPGFEPDHVLTASVALGIAGYPPSEQRAIQHKILDRVTALPGVEVAALTDWLPLSFNGRSADVYPEGYVPRLHESHEVRRADVTPGFFKTMDIPIVSGRDFRPDDNEAAPRVIIVDQSAAAHYWPGADAIGRRLQIWGGLYTVIGVVRNTKHQFINERPEPMVYLSFFQNSNETTVMVRTKGDPTLIATAIEDTIHQVDGQIAVFDVRPLRETTQISSTFVIMESTFAGIFAIIALILAATGVYGVVAYRTELRTHEIGIRMALGASLGCVMRLVFLQGLRLTMIGIALGLALSFSLTRFIAGQLYGVDANDPLTVIGVAVLLGAMSLLACLLPAYRAMRLEPAAAIREL
ncbi:MAG TPA: ABC transporter permease [Terracidiphilus sp.]|nr:ABC transporter permease [Terracidiphilus sp.]